MPRDNPMSHAETTEPGGPSMRAGQSDTARYALRELVAYVLKLGTIGFGGPVALVGYMHRDLVERRKWVSEADYREGLALAQLAPGPLAAQLAIYLGYVHYRIAGATLAGIAFVLPSFLMVLALGWAYVEYGGLSWMQAVFYGVGASVIGIIAFSSWKLTRRTIGRDVLLWLVYLASLIATVITQSEVVWMFFAAGAVVWLIKTPPRFLGRTATGNGLCLLPLAAIVSEAANMNPDILWRIAWFFTKAGAFVF